MSWLHRNSATLASISQLVSTLAGGLWIGFVPVGNNWSVWGYHLLLVVAVVTWFAQAELTKRSFENQPKQYIKELLLLARMILTLKSGVGISEVRAFVHIKGFMEPDQNSRKVPCLCEYAHSSEQAPTDTGPVDLDNDNHKTWFFNVQAFHSAQPRYGDVDWDARAALMPRPMKIDRSLKAILSLPIMAEDGKANMAIGTVTFDANRTIEKMGWLDANGDLDRDLYKAISRLVGLIRATYLNTLPQ